MSNPDIFTQEYVRKQLFCKTYPTYTCPLDSNFKVYPCTSCGDQFLLKSSYEFHLNRESILVTYFCKSCNVKFEFTNKCQLFLHFKTHPNKTINLAEIKIDPLPLNKVLPLLFCQADATSTHIGTEVQSKSTPENSTAVDSTTSTISYSSTPPVLNITINTPSISTASASESQASGNPKETPKKRVRIRTKNIKKFYCPICDCKFGAGSNMLLKKCRFDHFQRIENPGECKICLKYFDNSCSLTAHKMLHESKAFICHECGYDSSSSADLQVHIKYSCSAGDTYVECFMVHCSNVCSKKTFKDHFINAHTKLIFKCLSCDFSCGTPNLLKVHSLKIHNEELIKGDSIYLCGFCKLYISKVSINDHISDHYERNKKGETSKVCTDCQTRFSNVTFYAQHLQKCIKKYSPPKNNHVKKVDNIICNAKSKELIEVTEKTGSLNSNDVEKVITNIDNSKSNEPKEVVQKADDSNSNDIEKTFENVNSSKETEVKKIIEIVNYTISNTDKNINCSDSNETIVTPPSSLTLGDTPQELNRASSEELYVTYPIERVKEETLSPEKPESNANDASTESTETSDISYEKQTDEEGTILSEINKPHKRRMGESGIVKAKKKRKLWGKRRVPSGSFNDAISESGMIFAKRPNCDDFNCCDFNCCKCLFTTNNRELFHEHLVAHRHVSTSHQCMECGSCFVAKSSFSTHLSVVHGISNVDTYIAENSYSNS